MWFVRNVHDLSGELDISDISIVSFVSGMDFQDMNHTNNSTGNLEIVDVARNNGTTKVVLAGDLDLASAPAARKLLSKECEGRPKLLLIDVSALEFVDSAGLSALVRADRALAEDGGSLALTGASARICRLLEITNLSHLLAPD